MRKHTIHTIIVAALVPLVFFSMFGFIAFGSASSGSGFFTGLRSSNKVFAPTFLGGTFSSGIAFRPMVRPTFQPVDGNLRWGTGFRWNFFDP